MIDRTEEEIMREWNNNEIVVSICCITYNHILYIQQCIDSFLIQKTNFAFEIIIHDDASTDGTVDVLQEYEKKYPNIITILYEDENQYSKGVRGIYVKYVFPRAKGKYIALCEGDDYWIDENKLQIQVDFLENNLEYTMCFSNSKILKNHVIEDFIEPNIEFNREILPSEIILNGGLFVPTPSIVFLKSMLSEYPMCCKQCWVGDYPLQIYCVLQGKVFCFNTPFVVYRRFSSGSWTSRTASQTYNQKREGIISELKMLNGLNELSNYKYNRYFLKRKVIFLGRNIISEFNLVKDGPWYNILLIMILCLPLIVKKIIK